MRIAVLGTGMVGKALATKFIALRHEVWMGARSADNAAAAQWVSAQGERAHAGTFAQAAQAAELVLLAVKGEHALAVVDAARQGLDGKTLVDITNPLDFSKGMPPRLFVCNDDSLAERIQTAVPQARVVKSLNTLTASLMVEPQRLPESTEVFVAGNDVDAKQQVVGLLTEMGHKVPIDLGGVEAARALEAWLPLWIRLFGVLGTAEFNLKLVVRNANV